MLETLAMVLVGYAGFVGWPWYIAPLVGAVAAMWNSFLRAKRAGIDFDDPNFRDSMAFKVVSGALPMMMLLTAIMFTGIYLLADWFAK